MHCKHRLFVAVRSIVLVALVAALNGCGYLLIQQTQSQLDETLDTAEITVPNPTACTTEAMSTLSASMVTPALARPLPIVMQELRLTPGSPPDQAAQILSETFYQTTSKRALAKMVDVMSPIKRTGATVSVAGAVEELRISRAQLRREVEEIAKTAQANGFRQLVDSRSALAAKRPLNPDEERFFLQAEFFARYFEYYFRKGHLLIVGLDKDAATKRLQKDLARSMGKELTSLTRTKRKSSMRPSANCSVSYAKATRASYLTLPMLTFPSSVARARNLDSRSSLSILPRVRRAASRLLRLMKCYHW